MSSSSTVKVWCLLVDFVENVCGYPFGVSAQHTADIEDLKLLLQKARSNRLSFVDTADFAVLRTKDSPPLSTEDNLKDRVSELFEGDKLETLASSARIQDLGLGENEVLIVQLNYADPEPQGEHVLEMPHLKPISEEYRFMVMSAHQRGTITDADLALSGVIEEQNLNPRIQEFEKLLNRPRSIDRNEANNALARVEAAISLLDKPESPGSNNSAPSDSNNNAPPGSNNSALLGPHDITMSSPAVNPVDNDGYTSTLAELHHMQTVLDSDYSITVPVDSIPHDRFTEDFANAAVFFPFAFGLRKHPNFSFKFPRYNWPFMIFIQVHEELYSYHPKNDFLFASGGLFRLMAEVQSQGSKDDKHRMLLQAACVVKFANTRLKKYQKTKSFLLVTVYINRTGVAERRIVYQDKKGDNVKYTTPRNFDLNKHWELLMFLRELYNLASWARTDSELDLEDSRCEVNKLVNEFRTSAQNSNVNPWTVKEPELPPSQRQRTADDGDEFVEQIKAEGYEVEPPAFKDSSGVVWELVDPPPSSRVWTVYKRSDIRRANPLIAKRVPKSSSHELEILQYLHTKPSSPYIIALDSYFAVSPTTYLIFPKLNRINGDSLLHGKIKQPCQSLVKGVAYLHANGVAHLDLKPDNLVYDATGQLKIIDFDLAVQVKDEEHEIEGYRGTPGWTAPEIGHEGGPKRRYSAIKADRWACGRILQTFLNYDKSGFSTLAQRLMARNPSERPSLIQWRNLQVEPGGAKDVKQTGTTTDLWQKSIDDDSVLAPPAKKAKMAQAASDR